MDLYRAALGVGEEAGPEEIKAAYHRLCLRYHPDRAGPGAMAKMAAVNEAYEALAKGGRSETEAPPTTAKGDTKGTVLYRDQAYAYYRHAQKVYLELRNAASRAYPGLYRAGGGPALDAFEARLLVALHYFGIVCRDYPDSEWGEDAEDKLRVLQRDLRFVANMRARPPEGGMAKRRAGPAGGGGEDGPSRARS